MHNSRRKFLKMGIAGGSVGLLSGCLGGNVASTATIDITADGFEPLNTKVDFQAPPQGNVTWTNVDDADHKIASASDNWDWESATMQTDEAVNHGFSSPGLYEVVDPLNNDPDDPDDNGFYMKVAIGADTSIDDPL